LGQLEQTGITEPLELKVKRARTGLGRDEIIQQEQQEKVW
jgi:ubiquitin